MGSLPTVRLERTRSLSLRISNGGSVGGAIVGDIAGGVNGGQPWNEQAPFGGGSVNIGGGFGSGNTGPSVNSFDDGWKNPDNVNFAAGMFDSSMLGASPWIRGKVLGDSTVDTNSAAYKAGQWGAGLSGIATGVSAWASAPKMSIAVGRMGEGPHFAYQVEELGNEWLHWVGRKYASKITTQGAKEWIKIVKPRVIPVAIRYPKQVAATCGQLSTSCLSATWTALLKGLGF